MEFSVKPSHGSACILLVFQFPQHLRWNTWISRLRSVFDSPLQTACAIDFFLTVTSRDWADQVFWSSILFIYLKYIPWIFRELYLPQISELS